MEADSVVDGVGLKSVSGDQGDSDANLTTMVRGGSSSSSAAPPEDVDVDRIRVIVRVRPLHAQSQDDKVSKDSACVHVLGSQQLALLPRARRRDLKDLLPAAAQDEMLPRKFSFDAVCGPDTTQEDVYTNAGLRIAENALEGYNGCLFVYGQTGSGKTFTLYGASATAHACGQKEEAGIVPRLVKTLYDRGSELASTIQVTASFLEIYNERLNDLLASQAPRQSPASPPMASKRRRGSSADTDDNARSAGVDGRRGSVDAVGKNLQLLQDPRLGIYVRGLTEVTVSGDGMELQGIIDKAARRRAVGATSLNSQSSRSHAVLRLVVQRSDLPPSPTKLVSSSSAPAGVLTRTATVNLVDLAGSERTKKAETSGTRRFEEGVYINTSLMVLGQVISALASDDRARKHAPFRSSKLTHLLQDSLSGNSRTCLLAAVSPSSLDAEETLGTLRFAYNAKRVQTCAQANVVADFTLATLMQQHPLPDPPPRVLERVATPQWASCEAAELAAKAERALDDEAGFDQGLDGNIEDQSLSPVLQRTPSLLARCRREHKKLTIDVIGVPTAGDDATAIAGGPDPRLSPKPRQRLDNGRITRLRQVEIESLELDQRLRESKVRAEVWRHAAAAVAAVLGQDMCDMERSAQHFQDDGCPASSSGDGAGEGGDSSAAIAAVAAAAAGVWRADRPVNAVRSLSPEIAGGDITSQELLPWQPGAEKSPAESPSRKHSNAPSTPRSDRSPVALEAPMSPAAKDARAQWSRSAAGTVITGRQVAAVNMRIRWLKAWFESKADSALAAVAEIAAVAATSNAAVVAVEQTLVIRTSPDPSVVIATLEAVTSKSEKGPRAAHQFASEMQSAKASTSRPAASEADQAGYSRCPIGQVTGVSKPPAATDTRRPKITPIVSPPQASLSPPEQLAAYRTCYRERSESPGAQFDGTAQQGGPYQSRTQPRSMASETSGASPSPNRLAITVVRERSCQGGRVSRAATPIDRQQLTPRTSPTPERLKPALLSPRVATTPSATTARPMPSPGQSRTPRSMHTATGPRGTTNVAAHPCRPAAAALPTRGYPRDVR